jgi:hypothetical protein
MFALYLSKQRFKNLEYYDSTGKQAAAAAADPWFKNKIA